MYILIQTSIALIIGKIFWGAAGIITTIIIHVCVCVCVLCLVAQLCPTLWSHGPPMWFLPWNSPGENTRVGGLPLLQGFFPTQESNWGLLHCRQILYQLSYQGSPIYTYSSILLEKDSFASAWRILWKSVKDIKLHLQKQIWIFEFRLNKSS